MDRVLRALFFAVVRPAGAILRSRRDVLRLREPKTSNWRSAGR